VSSILTEGSNNMFNGRFIEWYKSAWKAVIHTLYLSLSYCGILLHMKTQNVKLTGNIISGLGNGFYKVHIPKIQKDVICTLAGKMSKGHNKPDILDNVEIEVSSTDYSKGRITKKW